MRKFFRSIVTTAMVLPLTGCIPEDTFLLLQYAPDGQLVAIVSEKRGLFVADAAGMETRPLAEGDIDPDKIAWTPDSLKVAFASAVEGSLDIYITSLDHQTTRISSLPSREWTPLVVKDTLLYLTTESGMAELTSYPLNAKSVKQPHLPVWEWPIENPTLSPTGRYLAWLSTQDLRLQIYCTDLHSGTTEQVTSESDPLSLIPGPVSWLPDESGIGLTRNAQVSKRDEDSIGGQFASDYKQDPSAGTDLYLKLLDPASSESLLVSNKHGIQHHQFLTDGSALFTSGDSIRTVSSSGQERKLDLDLPAGLTCAGGDEGEIAFVAADQLVGITTSSLERARILTFDLEDKFLLAEEYFRSGSSGKSYDLYEELASSVQKTRDPQMARLVYIANLRRLGRTDKAISEIEKLIIEGDFKGEVPEKYLWRLLGYSYLLELNDLDKAANGFSMYHDLTSATLDTSDSESAINALQIIRETTPELARLYGRAVKARLNGDFFQTDKLFGELLTSAPEVLAVQREYINALEGFDKEVYYFSPTQRPFGPTRFQQAEYLERLVRLCPQSPLARDARLELFLLRIEMGSYSRARSLLNEALTSGSDQGRPEGILEVFRNYLETPEPQPWINQAIPEVFLHPEIRPRLEAILDSPEDRLLLAVVATKMALLQTDSNLARHEADAALGVWNQVERVEQSPEVVALYSRLLVMRAREAELRGLFSEAAEVYDEALHVLMDRHVDNFEFQEEIRFRAGLLKAMVKDFPQGLEVLKTQELLTGSELVNPTWEPELLRSAVIKFSSVYDSTTSTMKLWAAYESGVAFGKLQRTAQARWAFLMAASPAAPEFLRRKSSLELAALDEVIDPWNAARSYAQIAAFPSTSSNVRLWCSFQIARLHLSINYKMSEAREALALVISNAPDTPLAIQAQELLVSTNIR